MSRSTKKLPYTNIFVLGLFAFVLLYFLNCTPERTFEKPRTMEVIMPGIPIDEDDRLKYPYLYEAQMDLQKFIDTLKDKNMIHIKLTESSYFNSVLLNEVQCILRAIWKKKVYNLVLKMTLSKHSTYQDFVQGLNIAQIEGIECYAVQGYDFYYINCE